jgi:thioredoxin reductase (NADPH)
METRRHQIFPLLEQAERTDVSGEEARQPMRHLFLFIGAEPNTGWLPGSGIALDSKGFVLTGAAAGDRHLCTL